METAEGEAFVGSVLDQIEQLDLLQPLDPEEIAKLTDCFRALRNMCAVDMSLKDLLITKRLKTVETTGKLLKFICETEEENHSEEILQLGRCALQFLGNLVVEKEVAQSGVWPCICGISAQLLMMKDRKMQTFAAMVTFNCLNGTIRMEICDKPDTYFTLISSLLHLFHLEVEWALYSLQILLKTPKFLESYYQRLTSDDDRLLLLSIVVEVVRTEQNYSAHFARENLKFLQVQFEDFCSALKYGKLKEMETEVPLYLLILQILCECGRDSESPLAKSLQNDEGKLVKTVVETLSYIHTLSTVEESIFARVKDLGVCMRDGYGQNPFFGFKRDLIRLVANFAFHHDNNKRLIRELGGIPILLECTVVDANNPFITQWAIFAMKNMCENCGENQQFVAMLSPQSLAANQPLVDELNLQMTVDSEGKAKLTVKPK